MCGRYSLTDKDIGTVATELGAIYEDELRAAHRPRHNVAPTQLAPIVRLEADGQRWLRAAKWGFVAPRGPLAINARAESAAKRPGIREAFAARRCVVPADGFFEWQGDKSARRPIWFHRPDGGHLWLAGLWEQPASGPPTFLVLTIAPNDVVAPVHDRMPVVLPRSAALAWLAAPDATLLTTAPNDALVATPVSMRVNDVRNDDADCLGPPEPLSRQLPLL